jgi:glutamate racemase
MKMLLSILALSALSVMADGLTRHAPDTSGAAFTFDPAAWKSEAETRRLPIGVFDSGIGGLTVLEALLTQDAFHNESLQPGSDGTPDFAQERFIYFGDQANMPYGNYPAAGRTDYLRELILKDAVFLLGRRYWPADGRAPAFDKPPVKAIVIACNTATAYGLDDIRQAIAAWKIPVMVVGVVEAGARELLEQKADGGIGILATVGTCSSGVYPRTIARTLGLAGRTVPPVTQHGSAALAGVIEGDPAFKESVAECASREVRALAQAWRDSKSAGALQTIVLGCTHYPLAQRELDSAFAALRDETASDGTRPWQGLIANTRIFVNPAKATARELFRELSRARLRVPTGEKCLIDAGRYYLSVPRPECPGIRLAAGGALDRGYQFSRLPGRFDLEDTKNIPLTPGLIPAASANLVRERLPAVWRGLQSKQ